MKAEELLGKAERALGSARLLLAARDVDGACNRAYYAMFDGARAALLTVPGNTEADAARTHHGLVRAFGLFLVKTGIASVELGRSFNRVQELRAIADYSGALVEEGHAAEAVKQAEVFLAAMRPIVSDDRSP